MTMGLINIPKVPVAHDSTIIFSTPSLLVSYLVCSIQQNRVGVESQFTESQAGVTAIALK